MNNEQCVSVEKESLAITLVLLEFTQVIIENATMLATASILFAFVSDFSFTASKSFSLLYSFV